MLDKLKELLKLEEEKAETENALCGKHRYTAKILKELLRNVEDSEAQ